MAIRSLKLSFNGEVRRFSLESLHVIENSVKLEDLKAVARQAFQELEGKEFSLSYTDEEDDVITISTDVEVDEAFYVVRSMASNVLRLEVTPAPESSKDVNKAVHFRVICDGCGTNPIIGDRYKCSVRDDYDLCAKCEALDNSPHPYLKIKTPAQSPAAIMTILRPHQGVQVDENQMNGEFAEKIAETEKKFKDEVVDTKPEKKVEQKPAAGRPMPSMIRLECLSALREFGPFYACRKPNNTLVLIDPNHVKTDDKPWKSGNCLRLVKGGKVEMDGNGGPWASFHLEPVTDGSGGGGVSSSNIVRVVCSNRRLCLGAASGQLVSLPYTHNGIDSHFKFHEDSNTDEIDPVWDTMTWEKSENKAASSSGCWETPAVEDVKEVEQSFWEGMSNSLIEDVKAAMAANDSQASSPVAIAPPPPSAPLPSVSFVKDVSINDGDEIPVGTNFVKIWRFRNESDFSFPAGVCLVHVSGNAMGSDGKVSLADRVVHPFEEFDVSVSMTTPEQAGKYASFWRLEMNNERFGHQVWVEVNVTPKEDLNLLMKQAQEESEKIALAKLKTEQDQQEQKMLQEVARAQAEETLALQAAMEAERLEKMRLEKMAQEKERLALAEAERAHAEAEAAAREQAELAHAAAVEAELKQEMELAALVEAEEQRVAAEEAEAQRALEEFEESQKTEEANSIDWEHVDVIGNDEESVASEGAASGGESYASDLSASVEGAAMAGAALNNSGMLSESVVAELDAHSFEESMGKWGPAVTRLFEMGFDDVNAIVAACEKHATPENYDANLQLIVNEMLSNMPSTN